MSASPSTPTSFSFTITDVYKVRGRGRCALGIIQSGRISVGEVVDVIARDGQVTRSSVRSIESFRSPFRPTGVGDKIVLILDQAGQAAIEIEGQIVTPVPESRDDADQRESVMNMSSPTSTRFSFAITDVYEVRGRGRCAFGVIQSGRITVGAVVDVITRDGQVTRSSVRSIESLRFPFRPTGIGDKIVLILDQVGQAAIEIEGQIVTPVPA